MLTNAEIAEMLARAAEHAKQLLQRALRRAVAALRDPSIHILGHPRGRIYNFRLGFKADRQKVFAWAAQLDKAVGVDCYPDRQDLNVALLRLAKTGC